MFIIVKPLNSKLMKINTTSIVGIVLTMLALSCSKVDVGDDFYDVQVSAVQSSSGETSVVGFRDCTLFLEWFEPGESHFNAATYPLSDNRYYLLDISFPDINTIRPGKTISPTSFNFSCPLVNGGEGFTSEYSGSIFLVKKTDTEAVLLFKQLKCNVLYTDFLFDGYVRCPLIEKPLVY